MLAKKILLIVMCALILTVLIMTAVVVDRVMPVLLALQGGFDIDFGGDSTTDTTESFPTTEMTQPSTEQTQPTQPSTEPTEPSTEPSEPTEPVHEHSFDTYVRSVEASCIYTGYVIRKCECGQTKMMDIVDAYGHNYSTSAAKAPTCTESGCKKACTRCGDILKGDVIAALGHDYQPTTDAKASCTETVTVEYACIHCGGKTWETLEPLGHSGQWVVTQEPAEGQSGVETLENCANCGGTFTRPAVMTITDQSREELGDYIRYTIHVGTANTPQAFTYTISDYSKSANLILRWTDKGLNVTYDAMWVDTFDLTELELTINAEGKVGPVETPEVPSNPSEPSEPVEESQPSEPSEPVEESQPSEPSEPVEESQPSEPSEPVEESQPSEPSEPVEESQPSEPVQE